MTLNIAQHRLHNQRLVGAPLDSPTDAVRWLGAVQAQDYHGAKWALAQRTHEITNAALDEAFDEGAFLRTHVMRPTWHFVAPEDLRWLLALTAPRVHAMNTSRYRQLELDDATLHRGHGLIADALRDGHPLTRRELAAVLEAGGIAVDGQRLAYLVMHAELDGVICSGPRRGKQHTYALLDERVPPTQPLPREEALARLARRYFASHGPATPHDFAWWSGLKVSDARKSLELIAPDIESATVDGTTYWTAAPDGPIDVETPVVHLLPNYDEHVVAYRDHGPSYHPEVEAAGFTVGGRGLESHFITVNGLIVGGWRRSVQKTYVTVTTNLLVSLTGSERRSLELAAEAYGRFMGLPVVLEGD